MTDVTRPCVHYITTNGVGNAWVGNELRVLQQRGIPFVLHALRRPETTFFESSDVATLDRETHSIYPLPVFGLLVSLLTAPLRFRGRLAGALWNALTGPRESAAARMRMLGHLAVACHWARVHRDAPVAHIHAQWVHSNGSVAMYTAWLLGVSWSFTGHASDLYRERVGLADKIRTAEFIVCISSFHRDFFLEQGARPEQLVIVYCGVDVSRFSFRDREPAAMAGRILSSGRLVEKKGFAVLIDACAELRDRGLEFSCRIAGSGPLEGTLRARIARAGLKERVTLTGEPLSQEAIPGFMAEGAIYCLPCVRARDGDIDGLPQMLMEAMACGLPVVSTKLVGIPDLVDEGSGILVEAEDVKGLADALEALLGDPARRRRLAAAGRRTVEERFPLPEALDPLVGRFRPKVEAR